MKLFLRQLTFTWILEKSWINSSKIFLSKINRAHFSSTPYSFISHNIWFANSLYYTYFSNKWQKSLKNWNVRKRCKWIRHEDSVWSYHQYSNHSKFKYESILLLFELFQQKFELLNFRTGKSSNRTFRRGHRNGTNNCAKKGFLAWFIECYNSCYFWYCLRHCSMLRWLHGCKRWNSL